MAQRNRLSAGGGVGRKSKVDSCVEKVSAVLQDITEFVVDNDHEMNEDCVDQWKTQIEAITLANATLKNANMKTTHVLTNLLANQRDTEDPNENIEQLASRQIEEAIAQYNPESDVDVRDILFTLDPDRKVVGSSSGAGKIMDDDFEIEEQGMTEAACKCPYTAMTFVKAMKSSGCIHHVSKVGFDTMMTQAHGGPAKCPISGCRALWAVKTTTEDIPFQKKVERFMKANEKAKNKKRGASSSSMTLDGTEAEQFTQL